MIVDNSKYRYGVCALCSESGKTYYLITMTKKYTIESGPKHARCLSDSKGMPRLFKDKASVIAFGKKNGLKFATGLDFFGGCVVSQSMRWD